MSPPLVCPLYEQRLVYSPAESLRRAILTERRTASDLGALIRAESRQADPPQAALPLAPEPKPLPILDHINAKEESK